MSTPILPDFPPVCRDCGQPLDTCQQADGRGSHYLLVTCWNPECLLQTVTRSLDTYMLLSETELAAYRDMNRARMAVQHG